ncbi:MAG TPA: restriction endonuclease subunit S [Acidimicrobiales bacterium]|nr:restriction endonuclease subunit S [Acidimicrobiales bacterium]
MLFNATNSPELVGKTAYLEVLDEPAVFSNHFVRLRAESSRLDGRFLARWLRWQWERGIFRTRAKQWVNQATFSRDALLALVLPLPPVEEQRRIAAILDAADELRAKRRQSLVLLGSLTESIFFDMFGDPAAGWPIVTVESLAAQDRHAIRTGPFGSQLLHSEFVNDGIAVLGIDNAVHDHFAWGRPRFITEEKFEQLRRYQVRPGDVLVTIMATCGRVAVVPEDIPVAINTKHLCCITLDRSRCSPWYLWAAFRFHPGLRRQLGATARGAVMPGLNTGLIKEATLPLPPIEAQERFTEAVHAAERSSRSLNEHWSTLGALFTSLQHRAFRGEL